MKANKTIVLPTIPNGNGYIKAITAGIMDNNNTPTDGIVPTNVTEQPGDAIYPIKIILKGGQRQRITSTTPVIYVA